MYVDYSRAVIRAEQDTFRPASMYSILDRVN